jgi:hypothetical protein
VGLHQEGISNIFSKWKHETMKYKIAWSLLAVAVAGCGEVTPKDGSPDAGADGPPAPLAVEVRVTGVDPTGAFGSGQPDANAIVIFSGADSTVLQEGKANAQGETEAVVPAGSTVQTVQVIDTSATAKRVFIMTFHDVKPGDVLNAGIPRTLRGSRTTSTTMNGFFPLNQSYTHTFHTECDSPSPATSPFAFTFYDGCHGDTVDILGIQTSTLTPPAPSRYSVTRAMYASGGNVTLSTNWQPMANFVATMTNLPDDITSLSISRSTFMRAGVASPIAQHLVDLGDPPAGAAAASIPYAPGVGVRAGLTANLRKTGSEFGQRIEMQTADVSGAQTIDYNSLSAPWFGAVTYAAAERKLSWVETPSGTGTPDIRVAVSTFTYTRGTIDYSVTAYDISKPSATLSLTFAPLPAAYADFDPSQQTTAVSSRFAIITYVDQSNLNGYDEARGYGISIVSPVGATDRFADQTFTRRFAGGTGGLIRGFLPGMQ